MSEGYKQSQLGNIPKEWNVSTVEKEASICTGGKDTQDKIDDGIYPFFVRSNTIERINSYSFEGEAVLTSGDGVGVGKIYHYLNCKFDYHQRVYNIHSFSEKLNGRFFYYFFSNHFYERVMRLSAKNSVDSVRRSMISDMEIPLPPLPEQQKIAEILSTVDAKIEVIDQQITETQALKKGLMQRLLTKGIGHTEFKDSALGEIPTSWELSNLESHSAFITKGSTPTTYGFQWEEFGVQFLRSECVSPTGFILSGAMFISEDANNAMERSKIKGGDILMTITGNVGRVCIYPEQYITGNINQHIARVRVTDRLISSQFVFQFLSQSTQIQEYLKITTGQAYPQLSLKQVRETKIPIPPLDEQLKIAEILSSVDDKLEVLSEKKTYYQELKQGLMQQLLTGKIRVKTQ